MSRRDKCFCTAHHQCKKITKLVKKSLNGAEIMIAIALHCIH